VNKNIYNFNKTSFAINIIAIAKIITRLENTDLTVSFHAVSQL